MARSDRYLQRESQFTARGMYVSSPHYAHTIKSTGLPTDPTRLLQTSRGPNGGHGVPPRSPGRYRRNSRCGDSHVNRLGCARFVQSFAYSFHRIARFDPTCLVTKIRLLCILASNPGLKSVQDQFPDLEVSSTPRHIACSELIRALDMGRSCRRRIDNRRSRFPRPGRHCESTSSNSASLLTRVFLRVPRVIACSIPSKSRGVIPPMSHRSFPRRGSIS